MKSLINTTYWMTIAAIAPISLLTTGCETIVDQYGNQRQVMTPAGASALSTLVATGIGAGSGALLQDQPGWMNGMISSLSGSVASQLAESVTDQGYNNRYSNYQPRQQNVRYQTYGNMYGDDPGYQTQGTVQPTNPNYPRNRNYQNTQQVLYTRLPNGQFVAINP